MLAKTATDKYVVEPVSYQMSKALGNERQVPPARTTAVTRSDEETVSVPNDELGLCLRGSLVRLTDWL